MGNVAVIKQGDVQVMKRRDWHSPHEYNKTPVRVFADLAVHNQKNVAPDTTRSRSKSEQLKNSSIKSYR